jgi:phosphatidylglycerol---prolipoprotein diacylglyceryl transferase
MEFQSPGAILFHLGPMTVRWYGIMVALGFLAATSAATRLAKRWEIEFAGTPGAVVPCFEDKIINLALLCFIGGIIGARLYFVALSWPQFSANPSEIFFSAREGFSIRGLSIHGGIIGALIVGLTYCWRTKLPILTCCDLMASVVPLGQAIGRWGNFFNSEAFGRPVPEHFPLKLFIPPDQRPLLFSNFEFFHPTFLYECVWDLALFLILFNYAADRLRKYPGLNSCVYLAGYSIGRLLIEPIRVDSIMFAPLGLPTPSLVSGISLAIALIGMLVILVRNRRKPAPQ